MAKDTSTIVFLGAEVTLSCHGTGAWLSQRAKIPSPSKKILDLINLRWRIYIDFLKKLR